MTTRDPARLEQFDAVVVGAGPAGSTCARILSRAGAKVAVLDAAAFPRVKLCAGWLSAPVWDALELSPSAYPHGLWKWNRCHVRFRDADYTVRVSGYFIRRCEFDDYLLSQSGAALVRQHRVRSIERDADGMWIVDGAFRAQHLIGAGGTHCPVARAVCATRREAPVGVQEIEFCADAGEVAATRIGGDGEPELVLHPDLRGYAWNVPKTEWLNVGCGTLQPKEVRSAWRDARAFFERARHVPKTARTALDEAKGHSYYLFHADRLGSAYRDGALIAGDALGLAHPLTAEGILPAIVSGRLAGEAIIDGAASDYPRRLREHPTLRDYALLRRLRDLKGQLPAAGRLGARLRPAMRLPAALEGPSRRAVATGFAWLFAGRPLPGGRAVERAIQLLGGH